MVEGLSLNVTNHVLGYKSNRITCLTFSYMLWRMVQKILQTDLKQKKKERKKRLFWPFTCKGKFPPEWLHVIQANWLSSISFPPFPMDLTI